MIFLSEYTAPSGEKLAQQLATFGPLVAAECIGRGMHTKAPMAIRDLLIGHTVYGWASGAAKPQDELTDHVVVVVGCEQCEKAKARMYYLDPEDESPVGAERTVYTMAYDLFVERCVHRSGVQSLGFEADDERDGHGYLLAGPAV